MPLKKVIYLYIFPVLISLLAFLLFKSSIDALHITRYPIMLRANEKASWIDHFYDNDLTNQSLFSEALNSSVPVLMGSSELTSHHLRALAPSYFVNVQKSKFLAIGHAGFQSLAILSVLAANRPLLKNARLTIILSPGWFEKQYAKGTSLPSFFEYCPPNYMYQLISDQKLDPNTRGYLFNYLKANYERISAPSAAIRLAAKSQDLQLKRMLYAPYTCLNIHSLQYLTSRDNYLTSQLLIINTLLKTKTAPYFFYCKPQNWDSLFVASKKAFSLISNNNNLAVKNEYYKHWLKGKNKKNIEAVEVGENQELKDFKALLEFLKVNGCKPLFVIMPLNTKAHRNLEDLQPTIDQVATGLKSYGFKILDMFTPNLKHYEDGVLEDIMHPYDYGWYQIDKFIMQNYCEDYAKH